MKRPAEAIVQRGALEMRNLLCGRECVEGGRLRETVPIGLEMALGPIPQVPILRPGHGQIVQRVGMIAVAFAVGIAEDLRQGLFDEPAVLLVRIAEQAEHALAPRAVVGAGVAQFRDHPGGAGIERRSRAVDHEEAMVHPLHPGEPVEDGPYVLRERGVLGTGQPVLVVERLPHRVVHGDEALETRRKVGWRGDDVARHRVQAPVGELGGGMDGSVGDVVVPAIVVGERGRVVALPEGRGHTLAADEGQSALGVRPQFAQVDRLAPERAVVECKVAAALVPSRDDARSGGDVQALAMGASQLGVAALCVLREAPRQIHRLVEFVPAGLEVRDGHGPGDGAVIARQFHDGAVLQPGIEPEACSLAADHPVGGAEVVDPACGGAVRLCAGPAHDFRPDHERRGFDGPRIGIADAGNAEGRIHAKPGNVRLRNGHWMLLLWEIVRSIY
nr:hypothetical protein [Ralstonia syzygii]